MGLFDFLFGKKKQDPSFTLGVVNFFKGKTSPKPTPALSKAPTAPLARPIPSVRQ